MTKKKRARKEARKKPETDGLKLPDARSIEGMMAGLVPRPDRPVEEAQDIMYDAWESEDPKCRLALARQALEVSLDCADAYVMLAEEAAGSLQESLDLYRKGVEAGERTLGKEGFKEYAGNFWGFIETRPYMRARSGLAQRLWATGKREEAVGHYWEMLRLNPNDNQGIRDLLMPSLIELGRDEEAEKLYRQYKDDGMAVWMFSRALLDFRKSSDSPAANKSLKEATEENQHVPGYLLGRRTMPKHLPGHYGFGDDNEAVLYVHGNKKAWEATPGALDWLRAHAT